MPTSRPEAFGLLIALRQLHAQSPEALGFTPAIIAERAGFTGDPEEALRSLEGSVLEDPEAPGRWALTNGGLLSAADALTPRARALVWQLERLEPDEMEAVCQHLAVIVRGLVE